MDGFSFDHPSPDLGADILCGTPCSLWSNLQLPWDQSNAGDCADLTDILSGLQYIATDTKAVDAPTEIPPTTLCSMGSTKTDATASYNGWQLHHGQKEGDLTDAMAWLQSEPSVLGDDSRTQAPESQLFSLPLNQLGRLGGEVTALLSNNFGNTVTDLQVNNYNCKRALSAESSAELQCISSESNHLPSKGACNHYHQSFPNSLGNQADGSSTTTTTNSSPNSSVGDVNSIVLADILRWTSRMNTPAPRCGAARDEPKVLPFMDHNPPPSKKPRLLLEEGASYSPSGLDFRRSTVRSSLEPDPEAIAKVKEMIYRAAVMRPVALGRETTAEKPRRRNVKISSDPQTVAARERRERISDRLRVLQRLVPGGSKMDTATMLDEACNYLKFLKTQLAAGSKNHTGQGVKKLGASPSSLSSRYPLAPLQSRPTFPATLETLVNRISSSQFQNPSFPSSRS